MIIFNLTKHHKIYTSILFTICTAFASQCLFAQSQSDKTLCENFSRIGAENAQLRNQGKSQEQVIAYNSLYIADVMNRNNTFQDYLTTQVKKLYTEEFLKLPPEQIKDRLYEDCIHIFK